MNREKELSRLNKLIEIQKQAEYLALFTFSDHCKYLIADMQFRLGIENTKSESESK